MDSSDLNSNIDNLQITNSPPTKNDDDQRNVLDYLEVFILSESGKPIYCYNKRDDEATLLLLCQALINYYSNTQNDTLKYVLFRSGLKVTFSLKSPLIIVIVNHQYSGLDSNLIVNQIYAQIISTITNKTLKSIFEQSAKFDLRRLLGNSEKMIDYLISNGLIGKQLKNLTRKSITQQPTRIDKQSDSTSSQHDNTSNSNNSLPSKLNQTDEVYCFLSSISQSSTLRQSSTNLTSSNFYKTHLNRIMIPVLPINQTIRDSITNILTSSIASCSVDILYSILIMFDNDPCSDEENNTDDQELNNRSVELSQTEQQSEQITIDQVDNQLMNSENGETTSDSQNHLASDQDIKNSVNSQISVDNGDNDVQNKPTSQLNIKLDELSDELLIKEEFRPTATCHLITIANQNSKLTKLNTLDAHIVTNLMLVLKNQLNTVESLWLPICLPRFNKNAFLHVHFCLLNLPIDGEAHKNKFGLIQLGTNKEDFDKCQLAKNIINERLNKLCITPCPFTEIAIPILHSFWYQSLRSQTMIWKSRHCQNGIQCKNDYLVHYMVKRMIESNLKTFWVQSDRHYLALLGWHSPTFQLYIQFDVIATKKIAINAAQSIIKWIKKEEDKLLIKDYQ